MTINDFFIDTGGKFNKYSYFCQFISGSHPAIQFGNIMTDTLNSGFFGSDGMLLEGLSGENLVEIGHQAGPFALYKCSRQRRIVVLKCVRSEFRDNPLYAEMLRKEFDIGHSLNHPNIREYYNLTVHPSLGLCVEMEWVDGVSLQEMLEECRKDSGLRDKLSRQILDAVRFMHLKQVIHRDLKPGNILITRNGQNVKLIDFSIADSDSHFILKGNAGTARYASPEQIECRQADFRSDIFSIGVILSEMAGRGHFRKVARKCMRKDPGKRYSDIDRLEKALFSPSNYGFRALAALIATAAIIAGIWFLTRPQAEEEYVDSEAIDEIFRQATDLVEESGLNPPPLPADSTRR